MRRGAEWWYKVDDAPSCLEDGNGDLDGDGERALQAESKRERRERERERERETETERRGAAGNFVDLVDRGFYSKMAIQRSDGFVIQVTRSDTRSAQAWVSRPSCRARRRGATRP